MADIEFGTKMREQFCLSNDYCFINHGSWGTVPKCVLKEKNRYLEEIESNPDGFFRWNHGRLYKEMTNIAAQFVGADPKNLVLVGNATTGVNSVVKSFPLKSGEGILVTNLTYLAVRNACQAACDKVEGAKCHILEIKFPIESEDSIVELYEAYLQANPDVKLAIIDYITSSTALLLPVKRLIEVCRRHQVLVMVDGAHAPGHLAINVEKLGADFFTACHHKRQLCSSRPGELIYFLFRIHESTKHEDDQVTCLAYEDTVEGSEALMKDLFDRYKLVMCVCAHNGELFARISVQIYNTMADYEVLKNAVLDITKQNKPYCFINHGSWGTVPKCVLKEKNRYLEEIESNPDGFFRWNHGRLYKEMTNIAAEFVGADQKNLVLVGNATTGVNSVVKSFPLKSGEGILVTNLTYLAVRNACQAACDKVEGAKCHILEIKFPIESEDSIVELYEAYLQANPDVKLAIIDYITSSTALLLPVKRLIEVCRRHQVLVMVDGAHAPGHLAINVEELGADFFTGNLHKWCYVPRGCAVLWAHPRHQSWVSPLLTAHMYKKGMHLEFSYQATMDYSSYLCVKAGLKFYQDVGGYDKIHSYTSSLSSQAAAMLEQAWGTYLLPVPDSMRAPNMKMIRLPALPYEDTVEGSEALMKDLFDRYKLVMCVCAHNGELFARISVQIYNTMVDYEVLKNAVLDITKQDKP
ncbi:uncharacterized protein LOC135480892 [Liolophura sinensis]|uniref:uncharacterized protein LOC135480892 n=1 Tax=Liolophura sinensis TaxID=3198878 RepID=UPI00315822D0